MDYTYEPWFTCAHCGLEGFCEDFFDVIDEEACCARCHTPHPGLTLLDLDA